MMEKVRTDRGGCPYVEESGSGTGADGRPHARTAVSGKGGTGKTTIAGILARLLGRQGRPVLAIDGDNNPNLAHILGVSPEVADELIGLPRDVLGERTDESGHRKIVLTVDPEALISEYGADAPDGVRLLVMGRVDHAGAG